MLFLSFAFLYTTLQLASIYVVKNITDLSIKKRDFKSLFEAILECYYDAALICIHTAKAGSLNNNNILEPVPF